MATHDGHQPLFNEEPIRPLRTPWLLVLIVVGVAGLLTLGGYGVWYWASWYGKDEHEEYWAYRVEHFGGIVEWDEQGPYRKARKVTFISSPERKPSGDAFWSLQFLTNVKEVVIRGPDLRGAWGIWPRENSNLESLDLAETKAGDLAVRATTDNHPKLQFFDLSSTRVTDDGLAYLVRLANLRRLVLANTAITDYGLVHLQRIPTLQTLNLRGTKVTDAGVAALQQALPQLTIER